MDNIMLSQTTVAMTLISILFQWTADAETEHTQ